MKKSVLLALFAITFSSAVFSDAHGPIGQFKSIEIQGAMSFSSEEIVRALRSAPQLFVLSHAMADSDVFLNSLVEQTIQGYRFAGFPHVTATAETSSSGDHVVLKIEEGERFTAGKVVVEGLTTIKSGEVIELLTRPSQAPAFFQKPEIIEALFGNKREVRPIWEPGEPVKCTDVFLNSVKEFLRKGLAAYGRFFPKIDVSLSFDEIRKQADLHITVHDEGPPNVIGLIEIDGLRHHSREEILEYIHLREGDILNRETLFTAEQRLVNSGRFISVKLDPVPPEKEGDKLTLRISLQDAGNVPKLGSPLSELEQACMAFGEWIRGLPGSGVDIRASISMHETNVFSIATSASDGISFVVRDVGSEELSGTNVRTALLVNSGRAELLRPSAKETLVAEARGFDLKLKASVLPPDPELGRNGSFFAGVEFNTVDEDRISLRYEFDAPPCVFLWLAGSTNVTASLVDSILTIQGNTTDGKLKFDCRTQRLISMEAKHYEKPITMTFEAERGLFEQSHLLTSGNDAWNHRHPAGIVFIGGLTTEILSIIADLPEFGGETADRLQRAAAMLDVFVDAGQVLPPRKKQKDKGDRFEIPSTPEFANNPILLLAAFCYEQLSGMLPEDSWPVVVAREAAMMTAGNLQYLESSFSSLHAGDDMGPAGCLFLSELLHSKNPAGATAFAEKGLTLLNEDDFRKDVSLIVYALDSLSVLDPSYAYLDEVDWSRLGDTIAEMTAEEKRDQCRKDIIALQDIPANKRLGAFGSALWRLWHLDETLRRELEGLVLGESSSLTLTVEESHTGDTIQSLTKAAEQGDAEAQNNLAVIYTEGTGISQDYSQAVKWYTLAAEQRYAAAQYNLGVMYANGYGIPQDNKQAVEWYTKAAEQGYAESQNNLAFMYANGIGIPQDYKQALKWYTKAAEQGYALAQYNLGLVYVNGQGVSKDNKAAVKWITKAAEQGYVAAQNDLGVMYANGLGVPLDNKQAVEWYTKAAEQGYALAQYNLGLVYVNGQGVSQDNKAAVKWITKAAEQGYAAAQNDLGGMYYMGVGVLQDHKEAARCYTRAAEQGYAPAQYNLGSMYHNGIGVPQDYIEAYAWAITVAMNGNPKLKEDLAKELTPDQIEAGQARAKEMAMEMKK